MPSSRNFAPYLPAAPPTVTIVNRGGRESLEDFGLRSDISRALGRLEDVRGLVDATALSQAEFYIDSAAGDDENDGSSASPLKTINEYLTRIGTGLVIGLQRVYLTGDFDEGDYLFQGNYSSGAELFGQRTVIGTGTISAVQDWDVATSSDGQIEDDGLPVSWTDSGFVGQMVVLSSGANAGAFAWIGKDLGLKTARHSPFSQLWSLTMVHPAVGDTYEICTLSTITGRFAFLGYTADWGLNFEDVEFRLQPAPGLFVALQCWVPSLYMAGCALTAVSSLFVSHTGHVWDFFNCKLALGGGRIDVVGGAILGVGFCLVGSRINGLNGGWLEVNYCLLQNDFEGNVSARIYLSRGGIATFYEGVNGYYDEDSAAGIALTVTTGGSVQFYNNAKLFGTDNVGTGLLVGAGSTVLYPAGDDFTDHYDVTTAGDQVSYGRTITTYAAIGLDGVVNVANLAMVTPGE